MAYSDMGLKPFPIADTHVHITAPVHVDESVRIFSEIMAYFGYARLDIAAVTTECGHGESDHDNNLKAFYAKDALNARRADSAYVYANPLYYLDERDSADLYLAEVQELYRMGADGYKFLDGKPNMRKMIKRQLCDPIYDKMYAWLEEMGLPVLMHIADPRHFWGPKEGMSAYGLKSGWWCGDGSCPSFDELHNEVYEILEKFPKLRFRAAHCFFLGDDIEALTAFFERWENTAIDLTPAAINFAGMSKAPEAWCAFFQKYSHRIYFGTDTYNTLLEGSVEKYERWTAPGLVRRMLEYPTDAPFELFGEHYVPLGLDDGTLSDIYLENHNRLHPIARPLDCELIAYRATGMLADIEARRVPYPDDTRYALEEENMRAVIARFNLR